MGSGRRLLLGEFTLYLASLLFFALIWRRLPTLVDVAVMVAVALLVAGCQYLSEHDVFPAWVYTTQEYARSQPVGVGLTGMVLIAAALLPLYLFPGTIRWYYDGIFGLYIGGIGYRLVYGVVLPIPDGALDRV